jgi:Txe/YoeB family toxin of Txe-Axe toxin-antitoxin module
MVIKSNKSLKKKIQEFIKKADTNPHSLNDKNCQEGKCSGNV